MSQATILVVDDELFFRKLYCDLLTEEGYQVEVCETGDDAINRMEQGSFDLVLTDMVMPGRCGLEVLRAAKGLPNPPEVILITGYASLESAIQALKSGARDYLVKPFNPDEMKHQVRTCLEQRHLLNENQQLKGQIQLFQTGQALSSLIDIERIIPQALDALLRFTKATTGCGFLMKQGLQPYLTALHNIDADSAEKLALTLLPAMDEADSFCQPEAELSTALTALGFSPKQLWFLPLGDSDGLKGGLILCDAPENLAGQVPLPDLRFLCEQITLGFDNASRYQDAQELMYTDDLTGLYNHRYMQVALEHEIRRSQRYGLHFSLLFLDLDNFKQINDTHGHLAGSAALQEVGRLLRACVRDVDTLFRYGGDEFAAILVETDGHTAKIVAERIRETLEGHVFLEERKIPSRLTTTAGYATFPSDAVEQEALLELADRAMYVGKKLRNVVRGVAEIPQE